MNMKRFFTTATIIVIALFLSGPVIAQSTFPPDPGGDPTGNPPVGGGAPIGGGTFILMALGAAYGSKKLYTLKQEEEEK